MPAKPSDTIGNIFRLPISQLHPHSDNPFAVRNDSAMAELAKSVKVSGVLVPAIARASPSGGYELISGHRRKYACELAGLEYMPVIVLKLDDDEAIIQLVDSNIQRENILPSERAKAYKMKLDAMKHKAGRPSNDIIETSPKISAKFRSDDEDPLYEIVSTSHGCTLLAWESSREEWYNAQILKTPKSMLNALLETYASYLEENITQNERDLTPQEQAQIDTTCKQLREKCQGK